MTLDYKESIFFIGIYIKYQLFYFKSRIKDLYPLIITYIIKIITKHREMIGKSLQCKAKLFL